MNSAELRASLTAQGRTTANVVDHVGQVIGWVLMDSSGSVVGRYMH